MPVRHATQSITNQADLVLQNCQPPLSLLDFRLIVFDMDSTLINIECIDELAAIAGKKEAVASITAAAMRGELIDFRNSLMQRLALLKGLPEAALAQVLQTRLRLTSGASALLAACRSAGLKTLLVSGGFTYFAHHVQQRLKIDYVRANALEVVDGKLSGRLLPQDFGDVVDGAMKKNTLLHYCRVLGISPRQSIAVGDGANDLPMMDVAGLSVAYQAKPAVRARANVAIHSGGLDRLLDVLR